MFDEPKIAKIVFAIRKSRKSCVHGIVKYTIVKIKLIRYMSYGDLVGGNIVCICNGQLVFHEKNNIQHESNNLIIYISGPTNNL